MNKFLFFQLILPLFFYSNAFSQPFELDANFGNDGIVRLHLFEGYNTATSAITEENGEFILSFSNTNTFSLVKFHQDGSINKSFGKDGKAIADFEHMKSVRGREVVKQNNEKLVVVGSVKDSSEIDYIALARFHSDGSLDQNFGNNGKIITDYINASTTANAIVIQTDGKIVVVGTKTYIDRKTDFILFRFHQDGTLDEEFGNSGLVSTNFVARDEYPKFVKLQSDGKIIAGGDVEERNGIHDYVIARYNTNGSLDSSFGSEGKVFFDVNISSEIADNIILQSDGKILVIGSIYKRGTIESCILLVRFNKDGTLDNTFGNQGTVMTDPSRDPNGIDSSDHEHISSTIRRADGKLLISAYSHASSIDKYFLIQYTENGILDEDFGNKGIYSEDLSDSHSLNLLALESNQSILNIGNYSREESGSDLYLIRYLTDLNVGTLDFSIKQNSTLVYPNPIQQKTNLSYILKQSEIITIQLLNIDGQIIKTYVNRKSQKSGDYKYQIDLPSGLRKGVYFIRIYSPNGEKSIKIVKSN